MKSGSRVCILLACWLLPAMAQKAPAKPARVNFQRDVRPILSEACFQCHGPDPKTRMAGLRLDTREGAFTARKDGTPIIPGNPKASLILQRINEPKPARRMPPPYSHKTLKDEEKAVLSAWITQGAPWQELWSFTAPVRPKPPVVSNARWVRNPIDRFILARLDAEGLTPAPEADRRTLIRRVSLDLRGLPPSPEEVEAFLADPSPNAYESLVDRFLASPQYGEHRGRYWLDAARYADTHGIHVDNYREMWPYRDWVIKAFNQNMPFDQFTIEQIAGDLLPHPTLDQQIATGFHRCNVTTNEAGIIEDEFAAIYAKDRVDTTGAVWMGLTIGCATCHDHKFDPIKQKDFYAMTAFFRNTTQKVMDGNIADPPPIVVVPAAEDRERWSQVLSETESLQQRMDQERKTAPAGFAKWLESAGNRGVESAINPEGEILSLNGVDLRREGSTQSVSLPEGVTLIDGQTPGSKAVEFAKGAGLELPHVRQFAPDRPFTIAVRFFFPKGEDSFVIASQTGTEKEDTTGWIMDVGGRVPALRLIDDQDRSIQVRAGHMEQLKPGTWNHLVFTYDGSYEEAGLNIYLNGEAIPTQRGSDPLIRLDGGFCTEAPLRLGTHGKRGLEGGAISNFQIFGRAVTAGEARLLALWPVLDDARTISSSKLTEAQRNALQLYYLNHIDRGYQEMVARSVALEEERRDIRRRGAITHVQEERTDTKPVAHILFRGMYDAPREEVTPDVPGALPPMTDSMPRNRLGLAQWLMDPANPLTARVTVNRFWQQVFGTGIVKTSEDFGSQGEAPSNPELLDWLAVEFRESGWDVKKFFRLMVTSAAYRQAAATTDLKLKKDPDNRLISRGPRFRMDGEMVRDYVLAASGLLTDKIGGPSVKPYQPAGVWEAVAMLGSNTRFYKADNGEKLYRRSMYTFWKRSAPPPSMELFNAPTRETCTVRRERTDTPLQALVTMNDTQFMEAARHLAGRAMHAGELDQRFGFLASHVLDRPLTEQERTIVRGSYRDYLNYYDSNPADARKLLAVGESRVDEKLPAPDFAALTMVANQLFNLDEVLNK